MIVRNHGEAALVLARPAVRLRRRGVTVFLRVITCCHFA